MDDKRMAKVFLPVIIIVSAMLVIVATIFIMLLVKPKEAQTQQQATQEETEKRRPWMEGELPECESDYFEFTLEGEEMILPMTVGEFLQLDFVVEDTIEDYTMQAREMNYYTFTTQDDDFLGYIFVLNPCYYEQDVETCVIYKMSIQNLQTFLGKLTQLELKCGITFETPQEELSNYLGEPTYDYTYNEKSSHFAYEWTLSDYTSGIAIEYKYGCMDSVTITYPIEE